MRDVYDKYEILNLEEDIDSMCSLTWAHENNVVVVSDKHSCQYVKHGDFKVRCYNTGISIPISKRNHRVIR